MEKEDIKLPSLAKNILVSVENYNASTKKFQELSRFLFKIVCLGLDNTNEQIETKSFSDTIYNGIQTLEN